MRRSFAIDETYFSGQRSNVSAVKNIEHSQADRLSLRAQNKKGKFSFQRLLHMLLVFVMIFGIIQAVRSSVTGLYQLNALVKNKPVVEGYYEEMRSENAQLEQKIKAYSSPEGIEELARNSLNMVGSDEILVLLH